MPLDLGFRMHAERTPNPNSVKWVLSRAVAEGVPSANFTEAPSAEESPLAAALFAIEGVTGVFLGPVFVTVSKRESAEWTELAPPIVAAIKDWAAGEASALGPAFEPPSSGTDEEVVGRIREILDRDVQPFVAQDGGQIDFVGFRDGVVEVMLQGACQGCPSSTVTLKMGIEARLRKEVPEVVEVVAV